MTTCDTPQLKEVENSLKNQHDNENAREEKRNTHISALSYSSRYYYRSPYHLPSAKTTLILWAAIELYLWLLRWLPITSLLSLRKRQTNHWRRCVRRGIVSKSRLMLLGITRLLLLRVALLLGIALLLRWVDLLGLLIIIIHITIVVGVSLGEAAGGWWACSAVWCVGVGLLGIVLGRNLESRWGTIARRLRVLGLYDACVWQ